MSQLEVSSCYGYYCLVLLQETKLEANKHNNRFFNGSGGFSVSITTPLRVSATSRGLRISVFSLDSHVENWISYNLVFNLYEPSKRFICYQLIG